MVNCNGICMDANLYAPWDTFNLYVNFVISKCKGHRGQIVVQGKSLIFYIFSPPSSLAMHANGNYKLTRGNGLGISLVIYLLVCTNEVFFFNDKQGKSICFLKYAGVFLLKEKKVYVCDTEIFHPLHNGSCNWILATVFSNERWVGVNVIYWQHYTSDINVQTPQTATFIAGSNHFGHWACHL